VIHAKETGQVSRVTSAAAESGQKSEVTSVAEVGNDPTAVMELMTDQLMGCRLGVTSTEHPQYYLLEVLTRPFFSSPLLLPIKLCRYPLVNCDTHKSVE
jgi:hypothetical protein